MWKYVCKSPELTSWTPAWLRPAPGTSAALRRHEWRMAFLYLPYYQTLRKPRKLALKSLLGYKILTTLNVREYPNNTVQEKLQDYLKFLLGRFRVLGFSYRVTGAVLKVHRLEASARKLQFASCLARS